MDAHVETTGSSDYLVGLFHKIEAQINSRKFDEAYKAAVLADEYVNNLPYNTGKAELNQRYSNLVTSLWVELENILKNFPNSPTEEQLENRIIYLKKILTEAVNLTREFLQSKAV